jgi:hypothetical protein
MRDEIDEIRKMRATWDKAVSEPGLRPEHSSSGSISHQEEQHDGSIHLPARAGEHLPFTSHIVVVLATWDIRLEKSRMSKSPLSE